MENGAASATPGTARLEILTPGDGAWRLETVNDGNSTSFEDAIVYAPAGAPPGIVTLGGDRPMVRMWRRTDGAWTGDILWIEELGAGPAHMRHAIRADLLGTGEGLAMAAVERGLIGSLSRTADGWDVRRIDAADVTIDALAAGDLDGDGVVELYSAAVGTSGAEVRRHLPRAEAAPATVASLGAGHVRGLAVLDLDGAPGSELVALVTEAGTPAQIRRLDGEGAVLATLTAAEARGMTTGDVDGDGRADLLVSAEDGVWLVRTAASPWTVERVSDAAPDPRAPAGPAIALLDLDGDERSEAYVALDATGELVRFTFGGEAPMERTVIATREVPAAVTTRAITSFPTSLAGSAPTSLAGSAPTSMRE